jgi:hypothetical protein
MTEPRRLTVEFDDGTTAAIDSAKITDTLRMALIESGVCPPSQRIGSAKHYVLLEWDGWQEVFGVNADTVDLLRYFVIRRIEDRGRLSLNVGAEDPKLFIVKRLPKELKRIVVANATGVKTYDLSSEVERWEGIFESGGKFEYVKYDKVDPHSSHEAGESPETLAKFRDALKRELVECGRDPGTLLASAEAHRIDAYRQIARAMGIRGKEKQEDVYGFIELLLTSVADSGVHVEQ